MLLQGFIGKNAKIRIFRSVWLHSISLVYVQWWLTGWSSLGLLSCVNVCDMSCPGWCSEGERGGNRGGSPGLCALGTQMVVDVAMGGGRLMWLGIGIWVVVIVGAAWAHWLAW